MPRKKEPDKLIFLLPQEISAKLDQIFERLGRDGELRTQFENDPVGTLEKLELGLPVNVDISMISQVMFHLMGDEKFIAWTRDYNDKLRTQYGTVITLDSQVAKAIQKDISVAICEHLPENLRAAYVQSFAAPGLIGIPGPIDIPIPGPGDIPLPEPVDLPIPDPGYQVQSDVEVELNFFFMINVLVAFNLSYQVNVSGVGGGGGQSGPGG